GGTEVLGLPFTLSVEVRSPTVLRRQAEMLDTLMSNRSSSRRNWEVGSKPPRLKGDTTSRGTRKPSPSGPAMPPAEAGRGLAVTYSPFVPFGATGGGTW